MAAPRIAIVIYSLYGHVAISTYCPITFPEANSLTIAPIALIATVAEAQKKGIEAAGGTADIYQVAESLPQEVLTKMYVSSSVVSIGLPCPHARSC